MVKLRSLLQAMQVSNNFVIIKRLGKGDRGNGWNLLQFGTMV